MPPSSDEDDDMLLSPSSAADIATTLTPQQIYLFESSGFLVLRGILAASELIGISAELAEGSAGVGARLAQHPALLPILSELMDDPEFVALPGQDPTEGRRGYFQMLNFNGEEQCFDLIETPGLHTARDEGGAEPLEQWGGGLHDPSRTYSHDRGTRICQAVRCVWVLPPNSSAAGSADTGAGQHAGQSWRQHRPYAVVPGSHTAEVPTPPEILQSGFDDSDLVTLPLLRAGDLLLHAATLVHAVRLGGSDAGAAPRLMTAEYVTTMTGNWAGGNGHHSSPGSNPDGRHAEPPEWFARLSPTQQAALGLHPNGAAPIVNPLTGETTLTTAAPRQVGESLRLFEERTLREVTPLHPGLTSPVSKTDTALEREMYTWDCLGHVILRGVMDPAWVEAALVSCIHK